MEITTLVCVNCDCHVAGRGTRLCLRCGGEMKFKHIDDVDEPAKGLDKLVEDMRRIEGNEQTEGE